MLPISESIELAPRCTYGTSCVWCEIGRAGCGLCGLAAAALGARQVILTDLELRMCQANADANFSGSDRQRIRVQELHWGKNGAGGKGCSGLRGAGFDIILGTRADRMHATWLAAHRRWET